MKTINVYGKEYKVPNRINFVAVDEDGSVDGYETKPEIQDFTDGYNLWCSGEPENAVIHITKLNRSSDWKESLQDITTYECEGEVN